jgi:ABC-2 type transport system ATP-binding protein
MKGMVSMSIITLNNLIKRYGQNIAVDNLNLKIEENELFGLLGPNGAGKSTTINMICGLLKPTQGEISIDGISLKDNPLECKKKLGLVPQEIALFDTLSARENVEFFGKLSGLRGKILNERIDEALEFVGLSDKHKAAPRGFSGGMKRRLNIACAIVHRPKVIIMDEPTVGIDPQSRNHILESVRKLNSMGSTVIYTSHYMEEVEALCSRIAIIDHGKLIACGTKDELKKLVASEEKIVIQVSDISYNSLEEIKAVKGVKGAGFENHTLEVVTNNSQAHLQDVLFILSRNGVRIKGVSMVEPDLETVFLSMTGRKLRD